MKTISTTNTPEENYPTIIPIPNGWQPEGIALGSGTKFFVGSLANGAIYAGDLRTGEGNTLVQGQSGLMTMGLSVDQRSNSIFAAGGVNGQGRVYDASSGVLLKTYQFKEAPKDAAPNSLINDVIVASDAAYFTDSWNAFVYRVPLGINGALPDQSAIEHIALTGDFALVPPSSEKLILNSNGIEVTPDGKWLIIVQTVTGKLFRVEPKTGKTKLIDLKGGSLQMGDGLLFADSRLYVVQNSRDVAVVNLNQDFTQGEIERVIYDPAFRVPSTIIGYSDSLYVVNARFDTTPTPDVDYDVVKVKRK